MQKQGYLNMLSPSPEEREIKNQIDEITIKKLYDKKTAINHDYSSILKHENPLYEMAYHQLEIVYRNQNKRLDDWKKNYTESAHMTFNCTKEIIDHQREAANEDADQRILDYLAFKARLLMEQFPKQANYFQNLGWKSPIVQPETFKYPFRPEVDGETTDYKSIMFSEYETDEDKESHENEKDIILEQKPNINSIFGDLQIGETAFLNLPEGIALFVKIEGIEGDLIKFSTEDGEEISVPIIQFEDRRFFLQREMMNEKPELDL
ncbi:hypothetical protein M9Y10_045430 [Tritrichomonas musculus]|uniref:Uncharacterized protein n=1 Tax=Tritrichomonas musculus TaxID=1915356 RepID=A0ABR2JVK5_9EUKA